ncbi:tRNA (uracil-5-)-methyltransferase homolog B-like [Diadema setosum]|uniref:tRNA (uracil-5-)-methyltransferase homolog B-like n=1 Tax=Diadema setosum TaxID=31175 RepID=UPI003B3AF0D3
MAVCICRLVLSVGNKRHHNTRWLTTPSAGLDGDYLNMLKKAVSPLLKIPYTRQLQLKYIRSHVLLQQLAARLVDLEVECGECRTLDHMSNRGGVYCHIGNTKGSPVTERYRNKSDFSIGPGPDGNPKTVGYYVGDWKKKTVMCIPPTYAKNDKTEHIRVAEAYQTFLRLSPLQAMHDFQDGGHWRNILVRSNQLGQLMAVVTFHPQHLTKVKVQEVKDSLQEYLVQGEGRHCGLDSLYFQQSTRTRMSNEESQFELLHGCAHIYEKLFDLRFRISPSSFFQVNTPAAEVLYSTVKEMCGANASTTLIDVCCGTGTIGLVLAGEVKEVIGIEIVQQAVQDAVLNAEVNEIGNAKFLCGAAEKVLPKVMANVEDDSDVVMVVNPARAGLHPKVIKAIRNCTAVKRLIYVSCKPDGTAFNNFVDLCRPATERLRGPAFVASKAVPVDLFPHTNHCELVIRFER